MSYNAMFRSFFLDKKWWHWSILGTLAILSTTWYKVQLDLEINYFFGDFYNTLQEALTTPNSVSLDEFFNHMWVFMKIAITYIIVMVILEFFIRHYVFRWRTAMNNFYIKHWSMLRNIEGAAQRIQEDTMRFAKIVEGLGVSFMKSIMVLIAFLPLLWELSEHITSFPWVGELEHGLVYLALISSIAGTALLALVGIRLPGLEFNNQKVEAAYRKELVLGEDSEKHGQPITFKALYHNVKRNYYTIYLNFFYFDVAKWSYLQFSVIFIYLAMGPTIIAGAITLGILNQIIRAFDQVKDSFHFLIHSWATIVELMSIYKRLNSFEQTIKQPKLMDLNEEHVKTI
jgi:peptide/bleomycin uptake transporter